ncbi:MAG TPA: aldolase/citrate lyase family protein, partial [Gaiella sp.]
MASLQTARSFLFAPGSEERKLVRALGSGADAVVADLEDAVAPAEKAAARDLTTRLVAETESNAARLVRVNGVGTEWHDADVAAAGASSADGIVLPKATAADVAAVSDRVDLPIVAIVETAAGLREAFAIASHRSVRALMLGAVDLGLQLGLEPRDDGHE